MITVKLFGLLRLETGIKELQVEASSIEQVYTALLEQAANINRADIEGCVIFINGTQGNKKSILKNGDIVTLMSPVAGG